MPFTFNMLLHSEGVDPSHVRLLRHETKRHGKTPYALWRDSPSDFNDYQRIQKKSRRAYFKAPYWASFTVAPDGRTLFAGLFGVELAGDVPLDWIDPLSKRNGASLSDSDLYSIAPIELLEGYVGRLAIEWGFGTRSWVQLAANSDKLVSELLERFIEPAFPGFASFMIQLSEIDCLPQKWQAILAEAQGVYLLTCPRTHEQYVGSASGSEGFLARWAAYARDGHGGNVALKSRKTEDYRVSILQLAGSEDRRDAILLMEARWKAKLQSREMGLNRN